MNFRIVAGFAILVLFSGLVYAEEVEKPTVSFVFSQGCHFCKELHPYIEELEEKYQREANFEYLDGYSNVEEVKQLNLAHNVPLEQWGSVPKVFVNSYYCLGLDVCEAELEREIIKAIKDGGGEVPKKNGTGDVEFSVAQLVGFALADAVNPCEMAVLIILLTAILVRFPEKRGKVLWAGLAFALAIVIAYIIMGILIISGFKSLVGFTQIEISWVYQVLGIIAIVVGLLNIKDYIKPGMGGFMMEVPQSWRPRMKSIAGGATSIKGAFAAGLIVSLFLTPCTMGPYFLAGGVLAGFAWMEALMWLVFYNLIFISPMVAITLAVYGGFIAIGEVAGWREKNVRRLHLVAGLIMVAIGTWLILS